VYPPYSHKVRIQRIIILWTSSLQAQQLLSPQQEWKACMSCGHILQA
jgi:hypothetical protein